MPIKELTDEINSLRHEEAISERLAESAEAVVQATACIEVLEDTDLAIASYRASSSSDQGARYLALYGVLQALQTQEDALEHLVRAFDKAVDFRTCFPTQEEKSLKDALIVRHRAVGHPTKGECKNRLRYYGISRLSIVRLPGSFDLIEWDKVHSPEAGVIPVSVADTIVAQTRTVEGVLRRVIESLRGLLVASPDTDDSQQGSS